ncbi:MAG TPA: prepilin-type N-terminal cleavage/methylation domain-containing protein [Capsulimonadaceae bacterium]|jgi:prepilin-type N-terminal cleavage/methylation domain-containing protein/prepilin-type processing-associated H-X9-DG protein
MEDTSLNSHKSGFTLIELLVVIAIIAILAAILFPVFATARDKARTTGCLSNQKQLGLAAMQYVQDFDERFFGQDNASRWPGYVWPYIRSRGVFTCPADATPTPSFPGNQVISYAINANMFPVYLSKLSMPALTVHFFEANGINGNPAAASINDGSGWNPPKSATGCTFNSTYWPCSDMGGYLETGPMAGTCSGASPTVVNQCYGGAQAGGLVKGSAMLPDPAFPNGRHQDGSNFTFADGHCKWMPGTKVSAGGQYQSGGVYIAGATYNGNWWADAPNIAQTKGMVTFALQ